MRRFILLGLMAVVLDLGVFSQISIYSDDMPDVGDTIRRSVSFDLGTYDFEETGNNYNWDYPGLVPVQQTVDSFVSVGSTPFVYQLVFIYPFVSTIASPIKGFAMFPDSVLTDAYSFFKESEEVFQLAGYAATLSGIPLPLKYDDPDIWYRFPLSAGDSDSSSSSFEMEIPETGYFLTERTRKNSVDGWGELTTPYGNFETIRVKSVVSQYDSLYIDSLNMGFPLQRNYTEYKWLGNDFGLPLLKVTVDEPGGNVIQYIDTVQTLTGTPEQVINGGTPVVIHPNPAHNTFTLSFRSGHSVPVYTELSDLNGRMKHVLYTGISPNDTFSESFSIDELGLSPGIYLLNIRIDQQTYCRKLIVR